MVTHRASLDVPSDLVSWLEILIAARRDEAGGTWRALTSWDQAIVLLVFLAKGDTFAALAPLARAWPRPWMPPGAGAGCC